MMVAVPMPLPMQRVTSAVERSRRSSSSSTVPEQHRAGRAERVAHGDGPAIDVDLLRIEVEGLEVAEHDRGKGLVDLEEVDVGERHLGPGEEQLLVTSTGPVSISAGSEPILA